MKNDIPLYVYAPGGSYLFTVPIGATVDWDSRHTCTPEKLTAEECVELGVHSLTLTEPPAVNPFTHYVVSVDPVTVDGVWTQRWGVLAHDAELAAALLQNAKNRVEIEIKKYRDLRKAGGVHVNNKWFHSDDASRIQQLGLVLLGASIPAVAWKTMDGTYITMTQALAGAIFQATLSLDMALFATADMHINAMKASVNPENYDYTTGWPEQYT